MLLVHCALIMKHYYEKNQIPFENCDGASKVGPVSEVVGIIENQKDPVYIQQVSYTTIIKFCLLMLSR